MILAHVADLHLTERRGDSLATLDEQVEWLEWIGDDAKANGAELMLVAGDVFDGLSTPAERNAAILLFTEWSKLMPVVIVRGNHDRPTDLNYLSHMRAHNTIYVAESPDVIEVGGATIACLPWPRKANLVAAMGATSGLAVDAMAAQAMRNILSGFAARFAGDSSTGPRILLAHAELGAALTDSGQPLAGKADIELSVGDLVETGADYVALGHIHKHQVLGERVCYAGSPRQCTFGEEGPKGYCLVDVERGREPRIEHRRGPGRDLVTIEAVWDPEKDSLRPEGGGLIEDEPVEPGEAIRLMYAVCEDHKCRAAKQADTARERWISSGAHSVKLDARVIATHRVRSEEIREARTNTDRLAALWASRGSKPGRAEQIIGKLSQLESEVAS